MEMKVSIEASASNGTRENNPYIVLETSLMKELDKLSQMTDSRCIHRVPSRLRPISEKAYTPQVVSIGPLHHGKQTLKAMEEHKLRYLQYFLGRTNLSLMHYIEKIKDREVELRSCYSETIELKSEEFVKIILVDAIFLIEYLFRWWYPVLLDESDCIFGKPCIAEDAGVDLLMLENQLPFFILEELFDPDVFPISPEYTKKVLDACESLSIRFLSYEYLTSICIGGTPAKLETICCSEQNIQHFVDLLRRLHIAPILKTYKATRGTSSVNAPNIEELHQAGVKLKLSSSNSLFDIQFKDGILEIPKLVIVDQTQTILRNLIAYEQCLPGAKSYISDYVIMMDQLLDTPKDVGLLVGYGIVENCLGGNDELSTMINCITTGVFINPEAYYYGTLCDDLNEYCRSPWHKWIANLRQNYFNTPWTTISFIAASLLLIITMIQTICSIIELKT